MAEGGMDSFFHILQLAQPAAQQPAMPGSPPVLSPRAVVGQAGPPPRLALSWADLRPWDLLLDSTDS